MISAKLQKKIVTHTLSYLLMAAYALISIIPFLWLVFSSFKPEAEIITYPPTLLPKNFTLVNYPEAWVSAKFPILLFNSSLITLIGTFSVIFTSALAAYSMVIIKVRGRNIILSLVLLGLIIPAQTGFVPIFLMASRFGLVDTYLGVLLPYLCSSFGVFMLHQFFKMLPLELIDAARIDGLGEFRMIGKIVLPLSVPGIVTLGIFSFMNIWKDFFWPFLLLNSAEKRTVPLGLRVFFGAERLHYNVVLSATTIALIPIVIVFAIFQKQFVQGIALSGMKQ